MLGRDDLHWRGTKLYFGRRKVGEVERDLVYPTMWRVRYSGGGLSDMVNLTRAKDAAASAALRDANSKDREPPLGGATARFPDREASTTTPDTKRADAAPLTAISAVSGLDYSDGYWGV